MSQPTGAVTGLLPPARIRSGRAKATAAGVAMVSAGALALAPVVVTPTLPEVRVASSTAAVDLSAFENPLAVWGTTAQNLVGEVLTGRYQWVLEGATGPNPEWVKTWQPALLRTIASTGGDLVSTLGRSDVQAGLVGMVGNLADPRNLLGTLSSVPEYAGRLAAAAGDGAVAMQNALTALVSHRVEGGVRKPSVLQTAVQFLAAGDVFKAYSEINYWFLVDVLSAGRQTQLDLLKVPGDILADLGLHPLSRILGNSETGNDGLLGCAVIGNFGRALLGPPITAIFQTVEIIDAVSTAIKSGQIDTALSHLINAPAKIANAFLNGYVPGPLLDFSLGAGRGQAFPGIFSPTGPFDFLFNQIPAEIIRGTHAAAGLCATVQTGTNSRTFTLASNETESDPAASDEVADGDASEVPEAPEAPAAPEAAEGVEEEAPAEEVASDEPAEDVVSDEPAEDACPTSPPRTSCPTSPPRTSCPTTATRTWLPTSPPRTASRRIPRRPRAAREAPARSAPRRTATRRRARLMPALSRTDRSPSPAATPTTDSVTQRRVTVSVARRRQIPDPLSVSFPRERNSMKSEPPSTLMFAPVM